MKKIYNLAPFVAGRGLGEPDQTGQWIELPCTLAELAFRLSAAVDETEAIKGVPDPWAQPRTFADALVQSNHPLNDAFTNQWRGLLALFALAKWYENKYRLTFSPIALDKKDRFDTVFRELAPAISISEDVAQLWTRPVIVRLHLGMRGDKAAPAESHVIGMLNPACLIAGGRTISQVRIETIPWMAEGLIDPLKLTGAAGLNVTEVALLAEYLTHVMAALDTIAGPRQEQSHWAILRTALGDFLGECEGRLRELGVTVDCELATLEGGPDEATPLYRALWKPVQSIGEAPASDCQIVHRTDLPCPFVGVILVDSEIASTRARATDTAPDPATVHVFGRKSLRDVAGHSDELAALRNEAEAAGYLVITPEDLFTPFFLKLTDANITRHGQGLSGAALPLSPLALLICPPSEFANRMRLKGNKVSFELPLVGGGAHVVTREFADAHVVKGDWSRTDAAIWPDFADDAWHHYYAKFEYAEVQAAWVRIEHAISGAALCESPPDEDSDAQKAERAARLRHWSRPRVGRNLDHFSSAGPIPLTALSLGDDVSQASDLHRVRYEHSGSRFILEASPRPFEALVCEVRPAANADPVTAGLIILPAPAPRETPNQQSAQVAIDFGTTASVAFSKTDDPEDSGNRIDFCARLVEPILPTKKRNPNEYRWKFVDFLPANAQKPPLTTAWNPGRSADAPNQAVLTGVVLFQPEGGIVADAAPPDIAAFVDVLNSAEFNLKWDAEVRDGRRQFLRQFLIMSAAEQIARGIRAENIHWHFSYPQALALRSKPGDEIDEVEQFKQDIRLILREEFGYTKEQLEKVGFHLESEAAGRFIISGADQGGATPDVSVVLDIGGGTTDILICEDMTARWSGSYRIAGMDFFTTSFTHNPSLLEALKLPGWQKVLTGSERKAFALETLFSSGLLEDRMDEDFAALLKAKEADRLRVSTYLFLGGLAYYLGTVAGALIEKLRAPTATVAFGLCGRGARFPIRLGASSIAHGRVGKSLELFSIAASKAPPTTPYAIKTSDMAKLEVVRGMTGKGEIKVDQRVLIESRSPHILGITAEKAGIRTALAGTTDEKGTPQDASLSITDPASFTAFLDAMRSHVKIAIEPGATIERYLITNALGAPERLELRNQPAFIVALRWLVRSIASGRDSKMPAGQQITVRVDEL